MASGNDLAVTVVSAQDLKNVNRRRGQLRPYAVLWVDSNDKRSTMVDDEGGTSPVWGQAFRLPRPLGLNQCAILYIDVVHACSEEDTRLLIGSARLELHDVVDEAGLGETRRRSLPLKRPSGRPRGKVEVEVCVGEPRYRPPHRYRPSRCWVQPAYGYPCAPPQPNPYYPAGGYDSVTNNLPLLEEEEKSNFEGIAKVFAVGLLVGALGGLVLAGWLGSRIVYVTVMAGL